MNICNLGVHGNSVIIVVLCFVVGLSAVKRDELKYIFEVPGIISAA